MAEVCLDSSPRTLQSGFSPADRENVTDVQKHLELPSGTLTGPEGPGVGEGTREQSALSWGRGGWTPQVSYLGGQRLPVPQLSDCRPGLPAQAQ